MELPVKNLMRRINFPDFLSISEEEQLNRIEHLQQERLAAIEAARKVKTSTKSAARNKAKTQSGRASVKNDQKKLAELLAKLTPAQVEAIKKNLT
jgi:hypothetical protein